VLNFFFDLTTEREPEIAFIDYIELVIALRDGNTVTLKPDNSACDARR
jgi:hypothetical protein